MIFRAMRQHAGAVGWIVIFATVSTIAGLYILSHQRLRLPGQERYEVRIGFARATALTPGFGQPVTVAGVKVGLVDDVELRGGTTVVIASIDPDRLPQVHADARAALVPATPSKDMQVDLDPGTPGSPELGRGVVPVSRTQVPIDSDELTKALDADTRDYLASLISAAGIGLRDRGPDLRALVRTLRPTLRQVRALNTELAGRRRDMATLVHDLERLSAAFASQAPRLAGLIRASQRSLRASAREDRALGDGLALLPGTLRASRATLQSGRALALQLRPTLQALTPGTRLAPRALDRAQPVLDASLPLLTQQVRPLVRRTQPVANQLRPAIRRLDASTPDLTRAFTALRYFTNELVHDAGKERGYLFWMAWLAHNTSSILAARDSVGAIDRGLTMVGCDTASPPAAAGPQVALLVAVAKTVCRKEG